jgi:putative tryptophan/tyrosine transport system substrate-binding protein
MRATPVLVVSLLLTLLVAPLTAETQPGERVYRVGYLGAGQMGPPRLWREPTRPGPWRGLEGAQLFDALRAGLREHGYAEGRNLRLEFRWAEGHLDRLPALAAELVALPVDVLVVGTDRAALVAKAATRTTPIVFIGSAEPVGEGLVASLARPAGNLTGLAWEASPEVRAKALEFAKEAAPGISRVGVLSDLADPTSPLAAYEAAMETGARRLKLTLHTVNLRQPEDLAGALSALERARVDALVWCLTFPDQPVVDFALRLRLPSVGCWREAAAGGALMSYGPSAPDLWRRAAVYIDKILKGARPANLPVEQPTKFDLVINTKTAKGLGLALPPSLLARADELIE